jgi:hypothetical protein
MSKIKESSVHYEWDGGALYQFKVEAVNRGTSDNPRIEFIITSSGTTRNGSILELPMDFITDTIEFAQEKWPMVVFTDEETNDTV